MTKPLVEHSIYCVSDIETTKWSDDVDRIEFNLINLIVYDSNTNLEVKRFSYFNQSSIFMMFKSLFYQNNKRKPIVFYHNLAFDYRFLHLESLANRKSLDIMFAHSKILKVLNNFVEFKDSMSILTMSVERLGKNIDNFEKKDMSKDDLSEYCFRDIEIVQKSLVSIANILNKKIVELSLTIASESRKLFELHNPDILDKIFGQNTEKMDDNSEYIYDYRPYFYGGRTCKYSNKKLKKIIVVDCNSLYTQSMSNNVYPLQPYTISNKITDSKMVYAYLIDVSENHTYPLLPQRNMKNLCVDYKNGRKISLVSNKTFDYIQKHPQFYTIHEILEQHECTKFVDCFSYLKEKYQNRLNFRQKGDKLSDNSIKILLNAGYGKFAEKQRTHDFRVYNKQKLDVDEYIELTDKFIDNIFSESEEQLIITENKFMKKKNNLVFAFLITDYSRLYMQENLMDVAIKNNFEIYYTDTDSGFIDSINRKYLNIDELKLGAFKVESELEWFQAIDKKEYLSSDDKYTKAKGLDSKNITREMKEDYMNYKPIKLSRPIGIKSALRDNIPLNSVSHLIKQKRKIK